MFFIISLSNEIREARYMNFGIAKVLKSWIFPINVKFLQLKIQWGVKITSYNDLVILVIIALKQRFS